MVNVASQLAHLKVAYLLEISVIRMLTLLEPYGLEICIIWISSSYMLSRKACYLSSMRERSLGKPKWVMRGHVRRRSWRWSKWDLDDERSRSLKGYSDGESSRGMAYCYSRNVSNSSV